MTTTLDMPDSLGRAERVPVGHLLIDRTARREVQGLLSQFIETGEAHHIVTVNLQFLGLAARNRAFVEVVNQADLVVADGMPLLWLAGIRGVPIPERVTGHDLLHMAAGLAVQRGYSLAFLGAAPGVAEEAAQRLRDLYPGLGPIRTYQGSFSPDGYGLSKEDEEGLVEALRTSRPDFLFVALGCPKQEFWIARHLADLGIPVCAGIGGTLDVMAGRLKRAPLWMQQAGLEWSYRLWQEPGRLWKRYLLADLPTLSRLSASALSARRKPWQSDSRKARVARNRVAK